MEEGKIWDAIIVGGGPAGSTLAWLMVRDGWKVLVLDKALFPREKLCGGWITPPVVAALELNLTSYARERTLQEFHGFQVSRLGGRSTLVDYGKAVSYGVIRREFDYYLLQRSGARRREQYSVDQIQKEQEGWLINGALRCRLLIGAGGHFCPVARFLGADWKQEKKLSTLELECRLSEEELSRYRVRGRYPEIVYFEDIRGYGWIFRKGPFLNIGIGRTQNQHLRRHLETFLTDMERRGRIPSQRSFEISEFRGHPYKLHFVTPRKCFDEGVFLIGDSAGLTFNFSGEGIRPAVESARMAWETVRSSRVSFSQDRLAVYRDRIIHAYGKPVTGWRFRVMEALPAVWFQSIGRLILSFRFLTRTVFLDRLFLRR